MDRLDAIPAQEGSTAARQRVQRDFDFIERQVLFVQQELREAWQRKRDGRADIPCIPFYWVFSKLLRLLKEYPDGLTEAVVVTELTQLFQQKENQHAEQGAQKAFPKKRKIRDAQDMEEWVAEGASKALHATVKSYWNRRLTLEMENAAEVTAHMYLQQRFNFCVDFLHEMLQSEPKRCVWYTFYVSWKKTDREVAFTNAKLLERKEVDTRPRDGDTNRVAFTLLPTTFLIVHLDEERVLDRKLLADAISLSKVDQLVEETHDPTVIQRLIVKSKVLDIGAIRPCQTSLCVHRQVILLEEVDPTNSRLSAGATPNTKLLTQGLHFMVLWDDQVALSRLFRVGDILTMFHPFVHVCDQHDTKILHILNEYSSQQRLTYYFEYGSATVLFSKSCRVSTINKLTKISAISQRNGEMEQSLFHLDEIKSGWHNFSLYAHVRSINVSHGIPLLAAFFYAYYDPKTNQTGPINSKMLLQPSLDHTMVSKYYLVVILQVYIASSKRLLTIEVTGENALAALRLLPGQSVFFDGLVALDIRSKAVRQFRERGLMPLAPVSTARAEFAFSTKAYNTSSSSGVVVLCSDWESIFGKQSLFHNSSKLTIVNTTPGLINTVLDRSATLHNVAAHALAVVEMMVSGAGWLIPSDSLGAQGFTIDRTCEKGHSTTCAHKSCFRALEMMAREPRTAGLPKWKCIFCHEIFFGLQDTVQTYTELAITLENGRSKICPLVVLCQGDTVERLLGLRADIYAELPLADKRKTLDFVRGTAFRLVLSRCEPRHVVVPTAPVPSSRPNLDTSFSIHLRIDLMQPVDPFAAAHDLLSKLPQEVI